MIKAQVIDGYGDSVPLRISEEGVANVVPHQHPPLSETVTGIPTVESFVNSTGASDMRVNASLAAPQTFSIDARSDSEVFVKTIMITIADAGANLNEFGSIGALTNGVNFCWISQDLGEFIIKGDMKTNWDFVKLARGNPSFGTGSSAFRANNVSGNSEGFLPVLDMFQIFGLQYGIRLRKGTKDKLVIEIRDDVTGVDEFTAEASIQLY